MKQSLIIIALIFGWYTTQAQSDIYDEAYAILSKMIDKPDTYSFKKAVFTVENAFNDDTLDSINFYNEIRFYTNLVNALVQSRSLKDYPYPDGDKVLQYASLFTILNQEFPIVYEGEKFNYVPFSYDFDDIWGDENWSNTFVDKLLSNGKGNCHSLPYLYKILAEEIGADAYLALAPNHIYIKHQNQKDGWYNTELTSGIFPVDAWIMASGYVHLDSIRNGMYMKALNNEESIALTFIDLAQGFTRKFPDNDGTFVLKCTEKALDVYPSMINALLLKLEAHKQQLEQLAEKEGKEINEIFNNPEAIKIYQELNAQVTHIHDLGYRQMPKEMYLDWIISLKEEKEKYTNNNIRTLTKTQE